MRPLRTDDMFALSRIWDKLDIALDVKGKTQDEVGADLIMQILRRLHLARDEIIDLLASLTGQTPEAISTQPLAETVNMLRDVLSQDGVADFFGSLARSGS